MKLADVGQFSSKNVVAYIVCDPAHTTATVERFLKTFYASATDRCGRYPTNQWT